MISIATSVIIVGWIIVSIIKGKNQKKRLKKFAISVEWIADRAEEIRLETKNQFRSIFENFDEPDATEYSPEKDTVLSIISEGSFVSDYITGKRRVRVFYDPELGVELSIAEPLGVQKSDSMFDEDIGRFPYRGGKTEQITEKQIFLKPSYRESRYVN